MDEIFISYRISDGSTVAAPLYEHLRKVFGRKHVFRDVDSLHAGTVYNERIRRAAETCRVMLVIINDRWASVRDDEANLRLYQPNDWVRREIETALRRGIRIVPLLVNNTPLPLAAEVPAEIEPMLYMQCRYVRHESMYADLRGLTKELGGNVPRYRVRRQRSGIGAALVAALVLISTFSGLPARLLHGGAGAVSTKPPLTDADTVALTTISVGAAPWAVAADSTSAWVTNSDSNTVTRIDRRTKRVTDTIAVGHGPLGVALDGRGGVWVANNKDDTVTRIDENTRHVTATVPAGARPGSVVVAKDDVWVADAGADTVTRIDLDHGLKTSQVKVGPEPGVLATDGTDIWVGDLRAGRVQQINAATGALERTLSVGSKVLGIAISAGQVWTTDPSEHGDQDRIWRTVAGAQSPPAAIDTQGLVAGIAADANSVWAVGDDSGALTRYDSTGMRALGTVTTGKGAIGITLSGDDVWVVNNTDDTVSLLSKRQFEAVHFASGGQQLATINAIPTGNTPMGIAADGDAVWVSDAGDGTLERFTLTGHLVKTIHIGGTPKTVTTGGGFVWVGSDDGHLTKVNPATNSVVAQVPAPPYIEGATFADGSLWIASADQSKSVVLRINPANLATIATIAVGPQPLRTSADNKYLWTANGIGSSISKVDLAGNRLLSTTKIAGHVAGVVTGSRYVWVALYDSGQVVAVDKATSTADASIPVGHQPIGIAFDGSRTWVASSTDDTMVAIDESTKGIAARFTIGDNPETLAYNGGSVWVACANANQIEQITLNPSS